MEQRPILDGPTGRPDPRSASPRDAGRQGDGPHARGEPDGILARPGEPADRDVGASFFGREYETVVEGTDDSADRSPPPGQLAVAMAALMLGLLLMGIQLWLLTVALELYLGGHGREVWLLAVVSGLIFIGGLVVLKLLMRRPRLAH